MGNLADGGPAKLEYPGLPLDQIEGIASEFVSLGQLRPSCSNVFLANRKQVTTMKSLHRASAWTTLCISRDSHALRLRGKRRACLFVTISRKSGCSASPPP